MEKNGNEKLTVGPHAVFTLDTDGICTLSTGPALVHLGLRPGQLVGTDLFELYRDDHINVIALRRALDGESFTIEREFQGRLLSSYFEPERDADGVVTGALGVTTDITEQRRLEAQLRKARERASLLADVSAALSRDFLDRSALLRTTVRAVADAVGEVGLVWMRAHGEDRLTPAASWNLVPAPGTAPAPDPQAAAATPYLLVSEVAALLRPHTFALDPEAESGFHAAARRVGAETCLRVPLASRGLLLGAVDIARGALRGEYTRDETDLVTEMAERCALALDNALLLEAERAAREELVKFKALADASDNFIGISDDDDRAVYSNPRVLTSGLHLTGQVWNTVAKAQVDKDIQQQMRDALAADGRWTGDLTVTSGGTQHLVVNLDVFRIFHPDSGSPVGTAWIAQDVTELRETAAALRAANSDLRQFKALTDASPDFIAIADIDGKVRYVNPGGRELIGLAADADVTGMTIEEFATAEGFERFEHGVLPAALAHGHWEGESTLRNRRGGPPIPVATATFLVSEPGGDEPFAIATVQRDMSERLAAEVALRDLADQRQALLTRLVDAQEAERGRIAADVHDDPVQALAAVDVRLGLLRRKVREYAPDLVDGLDILQASVTGATDRLRALLFDLEPPNLTHGLTGALFRAAEEIFENSGIGWVVDGDQEPDMPDPTRAIAYRIGKEAMSNVRKHAEAKEVCVTVTTREEGLEVRIEDDGVGLRRKVMGTPSPGHRGILGMRDQATVAGGRCTVTDREGGGTVVTVWLPGPSPSA
jgi:PAS domain S-box-containing protein